MPVFIDSPLSKSYFFYYLESDFGCKGSIFFDKCKCFKENVEIIVYRLGFSRI